MAAHNGSLARDRVLMEENNIEEPKNFHTWTHFQRLDYIGSRILANSRTTKSHHAMKDEGYLSYSQMERRLDREVYVPKGTTDYGQALQSLFQEAGTFSRTHVERTQHKDNENSGD